MAVKDTDKPQGQLATALTDALEKKEMSMRQLSVKLEATYEHTRKLLNGMAFPSDHMLDKLCKILGVNKAEMEELYLQDKFQFKHGAKGLSAVSGKSERILEVERDIEHLTPEHYQVLKGMIQTLKKAER